MLVVGMIVLGLLTFAAMFAFQEECHQSKPMRSSRAFERRVSTYASVCTCAATSIDDRVGTVASDARSGRAFRAVRRHIRTQGEIPCLTCSTS